MAKGRLGQLLEEFLADLLKEEQDLVFVVLFLEAGVVKEDELGRLGQGREVAIEVPRLFLHAFPLAFLTYFPAKHSTKAQNR